MDHAGSPGPADQKQVTASPGMEELKAQAAPETDGAVEMATLSSRLGRKIQWS